MNSRNFTAIGVIALLVPLSVFLIIDVFTQGGNQLGNTFKWALIGGGALAFFQPRVGMFLFLILQYYADFLKRLMIIGDSMSMQDVMVSLGLGPVLVVAACIYCSITCLTGKTQFSKAYDIIFFFGCVGVSLIGLAQSWGDGLTEMGQTILGSAMIGMPAFASYCLFRKEGDCHKVLKCLVIAAIPMALYAIWQAIFGIAAWEERYILTGLSKVLYNFYIVGGGLDGMRPFSTLNTHTSVGGLCGTLFLICIAILARSKSIFGTKGGMIYLILGVLFLAGCFASQNRTTYFIPILYIFAVWSFKTGLRSILFYSVFIAAALTIIANSKFIDDNIIYWAVRFSDTSIGEKFGTLGTFQARLGGLMALSEARYWAPFGIPEEQMPFTHDLVSDSIMKYGYVPVLSLALFAFGSLFWWHRAYLQVKEPGSRLLLRKLTAITFSLAVCSLIYGNLMFVPPINGLIGTLAGISLAELRRHRTVVHRSVAPVPQQVSYGSRVQHS